MNPKSVMLGFIAGFLGFVMLKFWILPISRYAKIKQRLASALDSFPDALGENGNGRDGATEIAVFRRSASKLTEAFEYDLPSWYKIKLGSRSERPTEAAQRLMKLANTKKTGHALKQITAIKELLKL